MIPKTRNPAFALTMIAVFFLGTGCATTKAEAPTDTQGQNHEEHHQDAQTPKSDASETNMMNGGMMNSGMMEKMDMSQMKGMMQSCQATHKDHKMCDRQAMAKCQQSMGQKECMTMHMQMKKQEKVSKEPK